MTHHGILVIGLVLAGLVVGCTASPPGQPATTAAPGSTLPRDVVIASDRVGGAANTMASGIASLITKYSPVQGTVKPLGDPNAWLSMMPGGEVDLGLTSMSSFNWAYWGIGSYEHAQPVFRTVALGTPQTWSILVPADTPVRTPAELRTWLKGKRFTHGWVNTIIDAYNRAALANLGLTEQDIITVPVSTYDVLASLWSEGRVDAIGSTIGVGVVEQQHAARPLKFVSLDEAPDAVARMQEVEASVYLSRQEPGPRGVEAPIWALTYNYALVASTRMSDEAVSALLEVLYEHQDELQTISPLLAGWTPANERWASARSPVPYHPGAIQFYRSKGLWPEALEAHQQELLKRSSARSAG